MDSHSEESKIRKSVSSHQNEVPHSGEFSTNNRPNEYDLANMERNGPIKQLVPGAHKKVR